MSPSGEDNSRSGPGGAGDLLSLRRRVATALPAESSSNTFPLSHWALLLRSLTSCDKPATSTPTHNFLICIQPTSICSGRR